MDTLRVRAYNVRFGDAYLITIPDRDATGVVTKRHILIDVGNARATAGGVDSVFQPVFEDIVAELGGQPLDLYIMTHEHYDHVQGLAHAAQKLGITFEIDFAWITASAEVGYYDRFENARRALSALSDAFETIDDYLSALDGDVPDWLEVMRINNRALTSEGAVSFIRDRPTERTTYMFRGCDLAGSHPFQEAQLTVWAPEEDTSVYYTRPRPMALGVSSDAAGAPLLTTPLPPAGVDAGAFYNLVDIRRRGFVENLLSIDKAKNNTSIVFLLEWRGWRLLLPADAEQRSWEVMDEQGLLAPVHFLKVSHHLSHTGTPPDELLDKILPREAATATPDGRRRQAVVSTWPGTYSGIPDPHTRDRLQERCDVSDMLTMEDGAHLDFEFPDVT